MNESKTNKENWLYELAKLFRRDLLPVDNLQHAEQVADCIGLLYTGLMALIGLGWLAWISDWKQIAEFWWLYLLFGGIWYLLGRFKFFMVANLNVRNEPGYANTEGSLETIARWASILVMGPTSLWIGVVLGLVGFLLPVLRADSANQRWYMLRQLSTNLALESLLPLVTIHLFFWWGGTLPLPGLDLKILLAFLGAVFLQVILELVFIWLGYLTYILWTMRKELGKDSIRPLVKVIAVGTVVPYLPVPFSALAAWLYLQGGIWLYLFFMGGLILVAFIARQLSRASESSRQQSQQSQRLEQLARALLNGPPDASRLPDILKEQVPGMFMARQVAIWLAPDKYLLKWPDELDPSQMLPVWPWALQQNQASVFSEREALPWAPHQAEHPPLVVASILDVDNARPIGGIYVGMRSQEPGAWNHHTLQGLLPTVQTLASQISTAVRQARTYQESLAYQKTMQELAFARKVQTSFLPEITPELPGWTLAASLEPARQTSGDFYDFVPLPDGKLGILIADVADKGLGPALYMALCRTLIRTFAMQFDAPEEVLRAANQRILEDSRSDLFVTVFYAVLDAHNNRLAYCNAGHPPAILVNRIDGTLRELKNTGMALGVDESAPLNQASVDLKPGDVLFLYTDGVTDAQNAQGEFIDTQAVLSVAQNQPEATALDIQKNVLERIRQFVENAPQFDDITMIVLASEGVEEKVR